MACLFGHKWKTGKCAKCGVTFASVADSCIQKNNPKKLYEMLDFAAKQDTYSIISSWEPLALRLFLEKNTEAFEDSLEILYEKGEKNTYAFLLGRTHSPKAAAFLTEKLNATRLGNFFKGHGVAMHDLAAPASYDTVHKQCEAYSLDNAGPFYYALGAYRKAEDVDRIAGYIRRFAAIGKHSWGFSDDLRFAVAGLAEIGGQAAFDALMDVESSLRSNKDSKTDLYDHRAVVLYGLYLISRGNGQMTDQLIDVLTQDVGQDVCNSFHQYILGQIRGCESRVVPYTLGRLQALMAGDCNRYRGTDCEAIYCLYVLGRNGWTEFASVKPQFEAWLMQEDRFMLT